MKLLFRGTNARFKITVTVGDQECHLSEYKIYCNDVCTTIKSKVIRSVNDTIAVASLEGIIKSMILNSTMIKALAKEAFEAMDEFKDMKLCNVLNDKYNSDDKDMESFKIFSRCPTRYEIHLFPEKDCHSEIDITTFKVLPCSVVYIEARAFLFMIASTYEKLKCDDTFNKPLRFNITAEPWFKALQLYSSFYFKED